MNVIHNFSSMPLIGRTHAINFGYVPDPPEPDDIECDDTYHEGSCECCNHFEQCLEAWKEDKE